MKTKVCFLFVQLIYALCSAEVQSEINNETTPLGEQVAHQSRERQDAHDQQQTYEEDIYAALRELSAMLAEQKVELRQLQKESQGREMESWKNRTVGQKKTMNTLLSFIREHLFFTFSFSTSGKAGVTADWSGKAEDWSRKTEEATARYLNTV